MLGAAGIVGATVAVLWLFLAYAMPDTGAVLSGNGMIAMALGIVLSLAVGIGLMALVFYSSRRGYDDRVGETPRRSAPDDPRR